MPRLIFTQSQLISIKTLLNIGWSFGAIQQKLKKEGLSISKGYLSKLKRAEDGRLLGMQQRVARVGKLRRLSPANLVTLERLLRAENPPTQKYLANRFGCSTKCIRYAIRKLAMRLVKKPKGHAMTQKTVEKRRLRSRPLYRRLCNERWRKYVTSDEVWVYMTHTGGQRSVQYISRDAKRSTAAVATHVEHPDGVMVWVAISAGGVSRPLFVKPGAKINAEYYQRSVLKPFFNNDPLWNNGLIFHQDSAPAHKAKTTRRYLENKGVRYITPEEWMPSSPDCAPCDFFLWGYLKGKLNERKPTTIDGLKRAITEELRKIPQEMINRALRAWPKRCLQVYHARGLHIERFRA